MPIIAQGLVAEADRSFALREIQLGDPGPEEVVVEIKASGVCHTDFDLLQRGFQHAMGHEGAGIVCEVGSAVTHVNPGDAVILNWAMPCGGCFQCQRKRFNICEQRPQIAPDKRRLAGQSLWASFGLATLATHTLVPAKAVVPLTHPMPFTSAALLGCCVMTGYGSATKVAEITADSSVVVIGTGAVGLFVVQGAARKGAQTIIAIDINPERLKLAKSLGATHAIRARIEDEGLLEAAKEVVSINGRPADIAFECTAVPALAAAPLAMIANGGTAIAVSGFEEVVPIDMQLFEFDKTYINPLYGGCNPATDFDVLLEQYAKGNLQIDSLVSATYPLTKEGLTQAFAAMHSGSHTKSVLIPGWIDA